MMTRREASCSSSTAPCQWSEEENKLFENALAEFDDEDAPDRWEKVAARVPGKTVADVVKHYKMLVEDIELIESGRVPLPHYPDKDEVVVVAGEEETDEKAKRRRPANRTAEVERKKGVPWNEEEHRLFLMGLSEYGKGDWRSISRNCVVTRTPTQVASHAQKYFNRLNNPAKKERRRPSIHDIRPLGDNNPTMARPWIQRSDIPAMGGDDTSFFPSSINNSYGGLGSYMPNNPIGGGSRQSTSPSLSMGGFGDLPMANLKVGGFGNFTSVNFRDGPAYSVYDLPALQRR